MKGFRFKIADSGYRFRWLCAGVHMFELKASRFRVQGLGFRV